MNLKFILISLLLISPLIGFFLFAESAREIPGGDWAFHLNNRGEQPYPPAVAYILNFMEEIFGREASMYVLGIFLVLGLSYVQIHHIAKNILPGIFYLYFSGIPFAIFYGWILPQALMHNLILFAIASDFGVLFLVLFGALVHREWILALLFVLIIRAMRDIYDDNIRTIRLA